MRHNKLTDNAGNVVASYRYAVFGETMSATGPAATANIYRFSTKPLDVELASNSHSTFSEGLYYYGYRFYDAENGRWLNRDLIGQAGGLNLYGFVGNKGQNTWDILGQMPGIPEGCLECTVKYTCNYTYTYSTPEAVPNLLYPLYSSSPNRYTGRYIHKHRYECNVDSVSSGCP